MKKEIGGDQTVLDVVHTLHYQTDHQNEDQILLNQNVEKSNMIITKETYLEEVEIVPKPDVWQINAAALDLRIGLKIYWPKSGREDLLSPGKTITIGSKEHFLIQTLEKVTLPNDIVGVVYPRSGTNRKGITVDMTGIVDPGYSGHLMIPVTNTMGCAVKFYVGERIAQIMFHRVETPTEGRVSKYHESDMAAKPDKEEELELLQSGGLVQAKIVELQHAAK